MNLDWLTQLESNLSDVVSGKTPAPEPDEDMPLLDPKPAFAPTSAPSSTAIKTPSPQPTKTTSNSTTYAVNLNLPGSQQATDALALTDAEKKKRTRYILAALLAAIIIVIIALSMRKK